MVVRAGAGSAMRRASAVALRRLATGAGGGGAGGGGAASAGGSAASGGGQSSARKRLAAAGFEDGSAPMGRRVMAAGSAAVAESGGGGAAAGAAAAGAPASRGSSPVARIASGLLWGVGLGGAGLFAYSTQAYGLDDVRAKVKEVQSDNSADGALSQAAGAYLSAREQMDEWVRHYADPSSELLLPDLPPHLQGTVRTLVLDLDDLLVHSDWARSRGWRVFKRPGVEDFLKQMSQYYEIVIYTSQLSTYAEPIIDRLDKERYVSYRLYRDATQYTGGEHVRDLSKLNRDPKLVLFLGADPKAYALQPENALPVKPYKMEDGDTALLDMMPLLEAIVRQQAPDIRRVVAAYRDCEDIPGAFRERTKAAQQRLKEHNKRRSSFLSRRGAAPQHD